MISGIAPLYDITHTACKSRAIQQRVFILNLSIYNQLGSICAMCCRAVNGDGWQTTPLLWKFRVRLTGRAELSHPIRSNPTQSNPTNQRNRVNLPYHTIQYNTIPHQRAVSGERWAVSGKRWAVRGVKRWAASAQLLQSNRGATGQSA